MDPQTPTEPPAQPKRGIRPWQAITAAVVGVLAIGIATVIGANRDQSQPAAQESAAVMATTTATSSTTATTTTTTTKAPTYTVIVECGSDHILRYLINGPEQFPLIWQRPQTSCEAQRNSDPLTPVEQQALATASAGGGYDSPGSIKMLYQFCSEVDASDVYLQAGFSPSAGQVSEIAGFLVLCPNHPLAAQYRQSVQRGEADAKAQAAGELFASGTFRVGEQVQPGTYVSEGDISDCYWQRTDSTGGIIDNNFVIGAKRVQVTIRNSDHSFTSERCGTWRKIR